MNFADAMVLLLLAFADICLIVKLRSRRSRLLRMERMSRSLQLHIRSELVPNSVVAPPKRRMMLRAS
jgi:hypothetical protein